MLSYFYSFIFWFIRFFICIYFCFFVCFYMFLYIYITKGFISLYIYVLAFLFNHVYMSIRDVPY